MPEFSNQLQNWQLDVSFQGLLGRKLGGTVSSLLIFSINISQFNLLLCKSWVYQSVVIQCLKTWTQGPDKFMKVEKSCWKNFRSLVLQETKREAAYYPVFRQSATILKSYLKAFQCVLFCLIKEHICTFGTCSFAKQSTAKYEFSWLHIILIEPPPRNTITFNSWQRA